MAESRESGPHSVSGRCAIVDDDGDSAWLLLTDGDGSKVVADCWLYNRRHFARTELATWPRDRPPPAPDDAIDREALRSTPLLDEITFVWDTAGDAVAVSAQEEVLGFIAPGSRRGHSLFLRESGPWGAPFDGELFQRLFNGPAA
jgi:hypothetical protein